MPNRRERRSRPISIAPVIALAILATGISIAQQNLPVPAPKEPATAPATGDTAAAAADEAARNEAAESGGDAAPDKPAAAKGSPQRFEPTEKVRPDFDVAFPVDI
jgi:hypothetical protein